MNGKQLHAEFWETQMWLMLILATLLFHWGHSTLGYFVLGWAAITFVGVLLKGWQAQHEL